MNREKMAIAVAAAMGVGATAGPAPAEGKDGGGLKALRTAHEPDSKKAGARADPHRLDSDRDGPNGEKLR